MGVSGLWKALGAASKQSNLAQYRGRRAAVDASVWLHKAAYGCALELETGRTTTLHVRYCLKRVRLLRVHEIEPVMVFDGLRSVLKDATVQERREGREEARQRARRLLQEADSAPNEPARNQLIEQAREQFQRCVSVSPSMVADLLVALRGEGVPFVVAPYEADAQIAFLVRQGDADAVITEDSDCVAYLAALGLPCPVLTKLRPDGGILAVDLLPHLRTARKSMLALGFHLRPAGVFEPRKPPSSRKRKGSRSASQSPKSRSSPATPNPTPAPATPASRAVATAATLQRAPTKTLPTERFLADVSCLTPRMFIQACVLAGCDYVPALSQMGLKTALRLLQAHASEQDDERVSRALGDFARSKRGAAATVPDGYLALVARAEALFFHQRVYDRRARCLVPLSPLPGTDGKGLKMEEEEEEEEEKEAPPILCEAAGGGPYFPRAFFAREGTDFLGPDMQADLAVAVAEGRIDPATGEPRRPNPTTAAALSKTPSKATSKAPSKTPSKVSLRKYFAPTGEGGNAASTARPSPPQPAVGLPTGHVRRAEDRRSTSKPNPGKDDSLLALAADYRDADAGAGGGGDANAGVCGDASNGVLDAFLNAGNAVDGADAESDSGDDAGPVADDADDADDVGDEDEGDDDEDYCIVVEDTASTADVHRAQGTTWKAEEGRPVLGRRGKESQLPASNGSGGVAATTVPQKCLRFSPIAATAGEDDSAARRSGAAEQRGQRKRRRQVRPAGGQMSMRHFYRPK